MVENYNKYILYFSYFKLSPIKKGIVLVKTWSLFARTAASSVFFDRRSCADRVQISGRRRRRPHHQHDVKRHVLKRRRLTNVST